MKISVTLRCQCGAVLEEVADVECDEHHEHVLSHRHGRCPRCDEKTICVLEGVPPSVHAGVH